MDDEKARLQKAKEQALKELRVVLDKIVVKAVIELTQMDIAFLRARVSYLTVDEKNKFQSVLVEKKPEPKKEILKKIE